MAVAEAGAPWTKRSRALALLILVCWIALLINALRGITYSHEPNLDPDIKALARSVERQQDRLIERYKLFQQELVSFREMVHNSTNFMFVLLGALTVFLAKATPTQRYPVLLLAAIGFALLHYLHVLESFELMANIDTMSRLEKVLAELNGGPQLWSIREHTFLVNQTQGLSRNLLFVIPALACLAWWMADHWRVQPAAWQCGVFLVAVAMFLGMLAGWQHLRTFWKPEGKSGSDYSTILDAAVPQVDRSKP